MPTLSLRPIVQEQRKELTTSPKLHDNSDFFSVEMSSDDLIMSESDNLPTTNEEGLTYTSFCQVNSSIYTSVNSNTEQKEIDRPSKVPWFLFRIIDEITCRLEAKLA